MLGWEYPPHISGGLGTACLGLTQGLAHHGVEVTFVVPKTYGDEDTQHLRLIGLDAFPAVAAPAASEDEEGGGSTEDDLPRGPDAPAARTPGARGEDSAGASVGRTGPVEVLGVPSLLSPYLEAEAYAARIEALAPGAPGAAPALDVPPPRLGEGAEAWNRFTREVARHVRRAPGTEKRARIFGGGYGPGLFEEVARYAQAVTEASRDVAFDVVHAHDWMTFPAGLAAARASGKPLVAQVHASEYDRSGEHPDRRVRDIEQLGLLYADRVVAVSHYTASVLKRNYYVDKKKLRVVHNAVTQEESRRGNWRKTIDDPVVLFLGRVTFQKGPDYFLEAARRVVERVPNVKFVMSGSGDMLSRMIEHAARLGIARNVHFTGFLRGRDVERMYATADLYVMPSVSEPFGITPLEAMALDVPVIVSRQSGVSEILRHALKVDFWDVEDLANKILAVLQRPVLRRTLRDEGRAEVRRLRWEASGARLLRIYEELAS